MTPKREKLKTAGFYREISYGEPHGESIFAVLDKGDPSLQKKIIAYLQAGHTYVCAPGLSQDVTVPEDDIVTGSIAIMSDGIWTWPKELIYYVEKYNVALPEDFVAFIQSQNWQVSKAAEEYDYSAECDSGD